MPSVAQSFEHCVHEVRKLEPEGLGGVVAVCNIFYNAAEHSSTKFPLSFFSSAVCLCGLLIWYYQIQKMVNLCQNTPQVWQSNWRKSRMLLSAICVMHSPHRVNGITAR